MLICIQIVILLYKGLKLTQKLTQKFYDLTKYINIKKYFETKEIEKINKK